MGAQSRKVLLDVAVFDRRRPANQRMPTAAIGAATVEIFALAELLGKRLLVVGLERKSRFNDRGVLEAHLACNDVVELGARIIAKRAEIADLARGIGFL